MDHPYCDCCHDLHEVVENALTAGYRFAGRNLRIEFQNDGVVLKGAVGCYYHKQLAQESLREIDGIQRIRNEIEVVAD